MADLVAATVETLQTRAQENFAGALTVTLLENILLAYTMTLLENLTMTLLENTRDQRCSGTEIHFQF